MLGRYLTVQAQTGAVAEVCAVGKDTHPVLRQLPSGDVLLAKDGACRFLGAPTQTLNPVSSPRFLISSTSWPVHAGYRTRSPSQRGRETPPRLPASGKNLRTNITI